MLAVLVLMAFLYSSPSLNDFQALLASNEPSPAAVNSQQSAKQVAEEFELHYRRAKTVAGVFLEKYTSGGSGIVVESGKVYFEKPGRMRWDYDSPETKMFLVDGKNVWYYVPGDHTASRTSIKESADWRTPLALLVGKVNLERLCGKLALGSAGENGNSMLICEPRKMDEDMFTEVVLELNSQNQLARLDMKQPGDVETEFRFGDWHENMPLNEARFHFEPPAGVAIVDDSALAMKVQ